MHETEYLLCANRRWRVCSSGAGLISWFVVAFEV